MTPATRTPTFRCACRSAGLLACGRSSRPTASSAHLGPLDPCGPRAALFGKSQLAMSKREFLQTLAVAAAAGFPFANDSDGAPATSDFYDLHRFGNNVTLMHVTDCHAQLLPNYFREP